MPRQARLNLPGLFYHVIVRGIERRRIFRAPSDRLDFLRRLGASLSSSGCRCFAWALMPNHIHMLILSGARGLVSLMHPLLTGYAVRFNLTYGRVGHLFQNRYKSIICQQDPYFLELVRYIPLNPVRAGIVKSPEELARYPWTSYAAMTGKMNPLWLERDEVLGRFAPDPAEATGAYERFIQDKWNQGHQSTLEGGGLLRSMGGLENVLQARRAGERQLADVRILGDGAFVENILHQAETEERKAEKIRKKWSKEALGRHMATWAGTDPEVLFSKDRRQPVADARAMLVHAAVDWLGLQSSRVAEWMNLSRAGVSRARARGRELARTRPLFEWLDSQLRNNVP